MDFLLECIGFPPTYGEDDVVDIVRERGEPAPWRGAGEHHRILSLGSGLEIRADRDPQQAFWALTPHYRVPHRLRLAVTSIVRPPDAPFDALLSGWASPPAPVDREEGHAPGLYRLSTWISDARRLGRRVESGHVLAVSVAGFAVHVDRVIENAAVEPKSILERPAGASIRPLGAPDEPGGCCDVSVRIRAVQRVRNEVTGEPVEIAVCDTPDRPMLLFVSPWQLEGEALPALGPGRRLEGTFLFTGRLAGGLPRRAAPTFG